MVPKLLAVSKRSFRLEAQTMLLVDLVLLHEEPYQVVLASLFLGSYLGPLDASCRVLDL